MGAWEEEEHPQKRDKNLRGLSRLTFVEGEGEGERIRLLLEPIMTFTQIERERERSQERGRLEEGG